MNTPPSPSPDALAAAMRDGLDGRRFFRNPVPFPAIPTPPANLLPQLVETAGLLGHPAPPGRGPGGWFGRLARRTVKRLMNPWLDRQTRFNHATVVYLQSLHGYLAGVAERVNALQAEVAHQSTALRPRPDAPTVGIHPDVVDTTPADDPVRVVEGLFLDTRLPPPPARVLVLAPGGRDAIDLSSRGYHVVQCANDGDSVGGSERRRLPYPDGSFDVAIALAGDQSDDPPADTTLASLGRVLTPGGQVIGSGPLARETRLGPLRIVERVYAVRAAHGWSLTGSPTDEADLTLWVATKN
jgi:hypothetical protein